MLSLLIASGVALLLGIGCGQLARKLISPEPIDLIPHPKPKQPRDIFLGRNAAFLGWFSFFLITYGVMALLFAGLLQGLPLFLESTGEAYAIAAATLLFFLALPATSLLKNRNQLHKKYVRRRLSILTFYTGFIGLALGGAFALGVYEQPQLIDADRLPRYLAIAALFVSLISSIYWPIPKPSRRKRSKRRRSKSVSVPYDEAYND